MALLKYNKTPVQELKNNVFDQMGIRLLVKREDLNHPFVSGNKWWKLKYNLEELRRQGKKKLLTFGGAFSNHIYATAAAATEAGLESVGIIRGEETLPLNSTLTFARSSGMELHYITRETYRKKNDPDFIALLHERFGDFYLIPEGGTNEFALKGCAEFGSMLLKEVDFDILCLPVGTGGTMAGIIKGLNGKKNVLGISVLKGGDFLEDEMRSYLGDAGKRLKNWQIETGYHFGGYGKSNKGLEDFMTDLRNGYNLPLEAVYTAKMMRAITQEMFKERFPRGSVILAIHTGGLQNENPLQHKDH